MDEILTSEKESQRTGLNVLENLRRQIQDNGPYVSSRAGKHAFCHAGHHDNMYTGVNTGAGEGTYAHSVYRTTKRVRLH